MHKTTPTSIIEALLKFWYTWSNLELRVGYRCFQLPFWQLLLFTIKHVKQLKRYGRKGMQLQW